MVRGGCRDADSSLVREAIEIRGLHGHHKHSKKRTVNFVIFVVDALSVHKMNQTGDKMTCANLLRSFKFPYTTFLGYLIFFIEVLCLIVYAFLKNREQ